MRSPIRRRAQALIETAAFMPAIVGLFFISFTTFTHFSREAAYTRAASTLAEWIGRTGEYDPDLMCGRMAEMLDGSLGIQTNMPEACAGGGTTTPDLYLYIVVYPSGCDPKTESGCTPSGSIGTPLSAELLSAPSETSPPTVAWFTSLSVPEYSIVSVDIWNYQRIVSLGEANGFWVTPVGHAISRSGQENTQ